MNNFKNAFIQYGLDHGHIKPIKETMKKEKSLTNDLFGVELITCPNCMGEGEIDETPKNATYELYDDCDICKGTGEINA